MVSPRVLIVFYSRTGTTKKVADALALLLHSDQEEIRDLTNRNGIKGYVLAGRDATQKRLTSISELRFDPSTYDLVIVGTPIWAWSLSAPIRTFLNMKGKNIQKFGFFWTMGGSSGKSLIPDVCSLCGRGPVATLGLTTKSVRDGQFEDQLKLFVNQLLRE